MHAGADGRHAYMNILIAQLPLIVTVNPCLEDPCENGGTCHVYGSGKYTCLCRDITCPCAYVDVGPNCEYGKLY